jgi:dTDP-4-amino-4,6-dideoxygalactose transaminase
MRRIDEFNESRRKNADLYRAHIAREDVVLPGEEPDCRHVYHQFTIRTGRRDAIAQALKDHDIASAIYYPIPLHKQVVFANSGTETDELKISEQCSRDVLSLPMFPELTEMEIDQI